MSQATTVAGAMIFDDFFEAERRRLFRALCLMTGDRSEAEEILQEAFLHLWERWDRVREMERPTGYLYRTAMNVFRSRRRRVLRAARTVLPPLRPDDPYREADDRDAVLRALGRLGRRQRAAVVLTDLLGYSSADAGRLLGVKPTSIRSLAAEARAAMRNELGGQA
jgi:RNA polymerase sigma factor (sigma-70 family)